jgi:TRAP-type C4-dicarboxylate transport system permease small subunit
VKRLAIGLCCCLAGVFLYGVNWLGAAVSIPLLNGWSGSRIDAAWHVVGYQPLIVGMLLIAFGAVIIIFSSLAEVSGPHDRANSSQEPQQ